jgi:hypothetical protein
VSEWQDSLDNGNSRDTWIAVFSFRVA